MGANDELSTRRRHCPGFVRPQGPALRHLAVVGLSHVNELGSHALYVAAVADLSRNRTAGQTDSGETSILWRRQQGQHTS